MQSHASYGRCGLGSDGTDRIVALVRDESAAAAARGDPCPLYGAKITGGGSGGAHRLPSPTAWPMMSLRSLDKIAAPALLLEAMASADFAHTRAQRGSMGCPAAWTNKQSGEVLHSRMCILAECPRC